MNAAAISILLATAALLGGCGGHSSPENEQAAANVVIADNGLPTATPASSRRPRVDPLALPTAFQGHWGLATADCDVSRPDAPGLMKIDGSKIDFHDETARVHALRGNAYRLVVDFDVIGGGAKPGQRRETLALDMGGTRILRTTPRGTSRYERC